MWVFTGSWTGGWGSCKGAEPSGPVVLVRHTRQPEESAEFCARESAPWQVPFAVPCELLSPPRRPGTVPATPVPLGKGQWSPQWWGPSLALPPPLPVEVRDVHLLPGRLLLAAPGEVSLPLGPLPRT